MMERNVMGELNMYRQAGAKPNFNEVARRHGMDRKTVAKYWRLGEAPADRPPRPSGFDAVREVIEEKAGLPGVTQEGRARVPAPPPRRRGAARLQRLHRVLPRPRRRVRRRGRDPGAYPRFETPPGRQLQFDRKEDVGMVDANGEAFEFNVFTATLGYPRPHKFACSPTRTTDDLLACLLGAFKSMGGVPQECLTDNMAAAVSASSGRRERSGRVSRFAREAGFELQPCRTRAPQTKGKDESANGFPPRLLAYDSDFVGLEGPLEAIARGESRSNSEPNETAGLPPAALFLREREHLRPIGNAALLESMVGDVTERVVPPTMLVRAAGRQRSVPAGA